MSTDATRWAWLQSGIKPAAKLVLLSLADRAGETHECYSSIKRLCEDTNLDRKTVIKSLRVLCDYGLMADSPVETNVSPSFHNFVTGPGSASQAQIAYAPLPSVPSFSPPPVPAEAPPITIPLSSGDSGRNMTVTMPTPDVGQDVRDRSIAHIATGGYSSYRG